MLRLTYKTQKIWYKRIRAGNGGIWNGYIKESKSATRANRRKK